MSQLAFRRRQAAADFPQALRMPQLAKQHCHELLPARESARMPLRFVLPYRGVKLQPREPVQNLAEDAAYSCHGRGLLFPHFDWFLPNPISTVAEPLPSLSCQSLASGSDLTKLICTGVVACQLPCQILSRISLLSA